MYAATGLRSWFAASLTLLLLVAASLPALADDSEDFQAAREAWETNAEHLADAEHGLEELDAATVVAAEAYDATVARLARAQQRLKALRIELAEAVELQRKTDQANDVAIRRLGQATMVLVTIEEALAEHAADLEVEVVAAYKYAGSSAQFRGVVDALQSSGSITEFTTAYEQLRTGTIGQKHLVDAVAALAARVTDQRIIVRTLQRRTDEAERAAVAQRRSVAQLTAEQTTLVSDIRATKAKREQLLAKLRNRQEQVTKRVAALEAQSDALMKELRKYRYVGGAPGSKDVVWPTDGNVTSGFGWRTHPIFNTKRLHAGIDIPAPAGQNIYAAADGTVIKAGPYGGYGNAVVIDHGEGMTTVYAHQSRLATKLGQKVVAGDLIGYVGTTGFSTGPHLHFEIRLGGEAVDPLDWY